MEKEFRYSVLKYRPSYLLDERVNIGLLFIFKDDKQVRFIHPSQLVRVKQLFPKANLSILQEYLRSFQKTALELSIQCKHDDLDPSRIGADIELEFINKESNNLFFSEPKFGKYSDIQTTLEFYQHKYFQVYDQTIQDSISDFFISKNNINKNITQLYQLKHRDFLAKEKKDVNIQTFKKLFQLYNSLLKQKNTSKDHTFNLLVLNDFLQLNKKINHWELDKNVKVDLLHTIFNKIIDEYKDVSDEESNAKDIKERILRSLREEM